MVIEEASEFKLSISADDFQGCSYQREELYLSAAARTGPNRLMYINTSSLGLGTRRYPNLESCRILQYNITKTEHEILT